MLVHTRNLGNRQFNLYLQAQPETAQTIFALRTYLSSYDAFYFQSLLSQWKGHGITKVAEGLKEEYQHLLDGKSFFQRINGALQSRKNCLDKIYALIDQMTRKLKVFQKRYPRLHSKSQDASKLAEAASDASIKGIQLSVKQIEDGFSPVELQTSTKATLNSLRTLFLEMVNLRSMTFYLIEETHNWRTNLEQWCQKCSQPRTIMFYTQQGKTVYELIQKDTNDIWFSCLSEYINFRHFQDPLIIRNVIELEDKPNKSTLQAYFIQMLLPKDDTTISRATKCTEMLTYQRKPNLMNLYEEEEQLMKSYLKMAQEDTIYPQQPQAEVQSERGRHFGQPIVPRKRNMQQLLAVAQMRKVHNILPANLAKTSKISLYLRSSSISSKKTFGQEQPVKVKSQRSLSQKQLFVMERSNPYLNKKSRILTSSMVMKRNPVIALTDDESKGLNRFNRVGSGYESEPSMGARYFMPYSIKEEPKEEESQIADNADVVQNLQQPVVVTKQDRKSVKKQQLTKKIKKAQTNKLASKQEPIALKKDQSYNRAGETDQHQLFLPIIDGLSSYSESALLPITAGSSHIVLQQDETPLSLKQFYQVFRSPTTSKQKPNLNLGPKDTKSQQNVQNSTKGSLIQVAKSQTIRQKIENLKQMVQKKNQLEELPASKLHPARVGLSPIKKTSLNLKGQLLPYRERKFSRSKLQPSQTDTHMPKQSVQPAIVRVRIENRQNSQQKDLSSDQAVRPAPIVSLHPKSIPIDTLGQYVAHLLSTQTPTLKTFTDFDPDVIISRLYDTNTHSVMFDVIEQRQGRVGTIIATEKFGPVNAFGVTNENGLKSDSGAHSVLTYHIEYFNAITFEMMLSSLARTAQQLLTATPCLEVTCRFMLDKINPVSVEFIGLIDQGMIQSCENFALVGIFQQKRPGYYGQDLYSRLYCLRKTTATASMTSLASKMLGNYRSLQISVKNLVMTSNFKLRSQNLAKAVVKNYHRYAVGRLYACLLKRILTKHHLLQIREACLRTDLSKPEGIVSLVRESPFVRSLIDVLVNENYQKKGEQSLELEQGNLSRVKPNGLSPKKNRQEALKWKDEDSHVRVSRFTSMTDLLNYLSYRLHDQVFDLSFLSDSRFILDHQLLLADFSTQITLQFSVFSVGKSLLLRNIKGLTVRRLSPPSSRSSIYFVPTSDPSLHLLLMDGSEYEDATTDALDLYSYLQLLVGQCLIASKDPSDDSFSNFSHLNEFVPPQIILPQLPNPTITPLTRCFTQLSQLFPEREFYSSVGLWVNNFFQNYYPPAVARLPSRQALGFATPLIIGLWGGGSCVCAYLAGRQ